MYIDLLYLVGLIFKSDIAPKFVHLCFGWGTGYLICQYLTRRYNHHWGLLGMLLFVSTPIVIWLSTSAYVDLGMTFFTTASVLSFIAWRDSGYNRTLWFLLSAFSMGIAVGSKYNALIALLIMNLFLMFSFVRDRKQQGGALAYGVFFFVIAFLAASPWYVRNAVLTGNPFYPLFGELFQTLGTAAAGQTNTPGQFGAAESINFFHMRNALYGESFWETLLIPLRMFFQGEDNSYRYFQGVLNPILIVFTPFLFVRSRLHRDHVLFGFFSVFFIVLAFFLTRKQVRYLLPTLPFLTILAVAGVRYLAGMLKENRIYSLRFRYGTIVRKALYITVAVLLSLNIFYLKNRVILTNPTPYIFGIESREAFLRRHLLHYSAVEFINGHLEENTSLFLMFLGRRGYYLERAYINEPSFGKYTLDRLIIASESKEKFDEYVAAMGATHIFMRSSLVEKYLKDNFTREEINRLIMLVNSSWKKVFEKNDHAVWALRGK